jgi:alpha-glucosidase
MTVGEIDPRNPDDAAKYYGRGDELHLAFNFSFLRCPWDAEAFGREIARFDGIVPIEGWPDQVLSNHDSPRHASRYDDPVHGEARARVAAMLLLTLRGLSTRHGATLPGDAAKLELAPSEGAVLVVDD